MRAAFLLEEGGKHPVDLGRGPGALEGDRPKCCKLALLLPELLARVGAHALLEQGFEITLQLTGIGPAGRCPVGRLKHGVGRALPGRGLVQQNEKIEARPVVAQALELPHSRPVAGCFKYSGRQTGKLKFVCLPPMKNPT